MTTSTITFHDCHKPALEDGHYSITVAHKLNISQDGDITPKSLDFYVEGPHFNLDTGLIHSVFPPAGGKGDYRANLPTLVLTRSTLPWERLPADKLPDDNSASWLFLLLIDESEKVVEHPNADLAGIYKILGVKDDNEDNELSRLPKKINYLELDPSLNALIPQTLDELQYLSYARIKNGDAEDEDNEEHAVLMCNRLPRAGSSSTVYLVSLENNYTDPNIFAGKKNAEGNYIFPYLYKWTFHTFDEQLYCVTEVIADNLKNLHPDLPDLTAIYDQVFDNSEDFETKLRSQAFNIAETMLITAIERAAKIPGSTFHELLSHLQGGFEPFSVNPSALAITWKHLANEGETFSVSGTQSVRYGAGSIWRYKQQVSGTNTCSNDFFGGDPIPNTVKTCDLLICDMTPTGSIQLAYNKLEKKADGTLPVYSSAWYRGPLAAGQIELPYFPQKQRASDLFLTVGNNPDSSYAAAWELGRLTALNDIDFSTEFFKWKHEVATAKKLTALQSNSSYPDISHLSLVDKGNPNLPLPPHVVDKFNAWKNLQGIPFRYLLPDPGLLPAESIRFFQVDANWVNAFISGAFSIGHTVSADLSGFEHGLYLKPHQPVTGFLIHSFAVSGWPDFEVDVTDQNDSDLPIIRKDNLDVNILILLYMGKVSRLSFHLHPGKMHSGFLYDDVKGYTKNSEAITVTPDEYNIVSISDLKNDFAPKSVADFASQMMEGTPKVIFTIGKGIGA